RFTRAEENFLLEEKINPRRDGWHVGRLGHEITTVLHEFLRVFAGDLVLRSAGKCAITFDLPRPLTSHIFSAKLLRVFRNSSASDVLNAFNPGQFFLGDPVVIVHVTARIGHGAWLRAAAD